MLDINAFSIRTAFSDQVSEQPIAEAKIDEPAPGPEPALDLACVTFDPVQRLTRKILFPPKNAENPHLSALNSF